MKTRKKFFKYLQEEYLLGRNDFIKFDDAQIQGRNNLHILLT